MSPARRVAVLWTLLEHAAELPFDDDDAADRVYRRVEAALLREIVPYAEAVTRPFGLAA